MNAPVFIVGAQRSGTTLLCAILNQAPGLYVLNELSSDIGKVWEANGSAAEMLSVLKRDDRFASAVAEVRPKEGDTCWTIFETTMANRAAEFDKQRWGVKDPRLTGHLKTLARQYPQGRFIIIIRDPRAVVASLLRHSWFVANAFHGARLWMKEVAAQLDFANSHPSQTFVIRYRELVGEGRAKIEQLCNFAGVPFVESMLADRKTYGMSVNEYSENAFRPIDPSIVRKWRGELSPRQLKIIESVAAPLMAQLDYALETTPVPLPAFMRWRYAMHQKVMMELRWQWISRIQPKIKKLSRLLKPTTP